MGLTMKDAAQETAVEIYLHLEEMVEEVLRTVGSQHDQLMRHFELGPDMLMDHTRNHVCYLAEAIRADRQAIYTDYVNWETAVLLRRGLPEAVVRGNLFEIRDAVLKFVRPSMRRTIVTYLASSIRLLDSPVGRPDSLLPPPTAMVPLGREYLDELLAGNRRRARSLIFQALEAGMEME